VSTLKRPNQTQKRVHIDLPIWIIDSLDKEARRIGVTRQSLIKLWLNGLRKKLFINNSSRCVDFHEMPFSQPSIFL